MRVSSFKFDHTAFAVALAANNKNKGQKSAGNQTGR